MICMADIQKRLWKFIYSWRDEVVKTVGDTIDFIIIYGSSVRGEFVPGKSDVDIVIQIFANADKKWVEDKTTKIFWRLAKHYPDLQFDEALSTSKSKKRTAVTTVLEKIEQSSFLYVPVFVFTQGEIDWIHGELKSDNPLINLGQALIVPQRSIFLRFKQEGVILFGRDIRQEIRVRLTLLDRLRLGVAPQLLSFIGLFISPIAPKKAQRYSSKALLYQIDGLLTALDHYGKLARAQKIAESEQLLLTDFTEKLRHLIHLKLDHTKGMLQPSDFGLFYEALLIKQEVKKLSHTQTIAFSLRSWWFIVRANLRAIAYILLFKS